MRWVCVGLGIERVVRMVRSFTPLGLRRRCSGDKVRINSCRRRIRDMLLYASVARTIMSRTVRGNVNVIVSRRPLVFGNIGQVAKSYTVRHVVLGTVEGGVAVCSKRAGISGYCGNIDCGVTRRVGLRSIHTLIPRGYNRASSFINLKIVKRLPRPVSLSSLCQVVGRGFGIRAVHYSGPIGGSIVHVTVYKNSNSKFVGRTVGYGTSICVATSVGCRSFFGTRSGVVLTSVKRFRDRRVAGLVFGRRLVRGFPGFTIRVTGDSAGPIYFIWLFNYRGGVVGGGGRGCIGQPSGGSQGRESSDEEAPPHTLWSTGDNFSS